MPIIPNNKGNSKQNNWNFILLQSEKQKSTKMLTTATEGDVMKREPHSLFVRIANGAAAIEISVENS